MILLCHQCYGNIIHYSFSFSIDRVLIATLIIGPDIQLQELCLAEWRGIQISILQVREKIGKKIGSSFQ